MGSLHMRKTRFSVTYRVITSLVAASFLMTVVMPPRVSYAQSILNLPPAGMMVSISPEFVPPLLRGVKVHQNNPFRFDFILDQGATELTQESLKQESGRLIKYFLASLTIPEEDLWVNLSPYEKNRIIPQEFGFTGMGRDLLAQDYVLKQLMASLSYPDSGLGKRFWDMVHKKTYELYGDTTIPINTFNKVWIIPEKAVVYEKGNTAFVVESHLKVLLEEDYLAMQKNINKPDADGQISSQESIKEINNISSQIARDILLPAIEKEVNEGKNFASLRQIYYSLILASWYKRKLMVGRARELSLLSKIYVDQKKVVGVDVKDKGIKDKIYSQYIEAFRDGVYNMIREDYDEYMERVIPRKYFSGGVSAIGMTGDVLEVYPMTETDLSEIERDMRSPVQVDVAILTNPSNNSEGGVSEETFVPLITSFQEVGFGKEHEEKIPRILLSLERTVDPTKAMGNFIKTGAVEAFKSLETALEKVMVLQDGISTFASLARTIDPKANAISFIPLITELREAGISGLHLVPILIRLARSADPKANAESFVPLINDLKEKGILPYGIQKIVLSFAEIGDPISVEHFIKTEASQVFAGLASSLKQKKGIENIFYFLTGTPDPKANAESLQKAIKPLEEIGLDGYQIGDILISFAKAVDPKAIAENFVNPEIVLAFKSLVTTLKETKVDRSKITSIVISLTRKGEPGENAGAFVQLVDSLKGIELDQARKGFILTSLADATDPKVNAESFSQLVLNLERLGWSKKEIGENLYFLSRVADPKTSAENGTAGAFQSINAKLQERGLTEQMIGQIVGSLTRLDDPKAGAEELLEDKTTDRFIDFL